MTKLGAIDFDDCILDALRDDRLIVFAGAGVSMGPPSNLASFWKLTCDIAKGIGLAPSEPLDRFLGQLHHRNVAVHERAAQLLSPAARNQRRQRNQRGRPLKSSPRADQAPSEARPTQHVLPNLLK